MSKSLAIQLQAVARYQQVFERISLNSNGNLLNDSNMQILLRSPVNLITFSLNTTNRESYQKLMGPDLFDRTVANIKSFLVEREKTGRSDLAVSIQFMSSEYNDETEMNRVFEGYLSEKVIVYNRYVFNKPVLEERSEKLVNVNQANFSNRHPCWSMYSRVYIDIEGNVYPCTIGNDSYRGNTALNIGNVQQKNLIQIFNDDQISQIRDAAEHERELPRECQTCTLWALFPNNFEKREKHWELKVTEQVRRKELDRTIDQT